MIGFNDVIENDFLGMLSNKEFAITCINTNNGQVFNIIKTDTFISIEEAGLPLIEDKPMFNTSKKHLFEGNLIETIIKQHNILTIESKNYIVKDIRNDGIGGFDIYLKNGN